MDNSRAFCGSRGGCPTKKRQKSRVAHLWIDRSVQIILHRSGDLVTSGFRGSKARADSGRFNGASLGGRACGTGSIDSRAYSGLQASRYPDENNSQGIQIGSSTLINSPSKSTRSADGASSKGAIWPSPSGKADLKPPSADSYLPYLDTI
jgi:hypothetical protein